MKTTKNARLITCILPQGSGIGLIERLSREQGISSANISAGRGRGAGPIGSIGAWDEIEMLTVTVPAEDADKIFDFIFHVGELDRPRGGIMFQQVVSPITEFNLPHIEDINSESRHPL